VIPCEPAAYLRSHRSPGLTRLTGARGSRAGKHKLYPGGAPQPLSFTASHNPPPPPRSLIAPPSGTLVAQCARERVLFGWKPWTEKVSCFVTRAPFVPQSGTLGYNSAVLRLETPDCEKRYLLCFLFVTLATVERSCVTEASPIGRARVGVTVSSLVRTGLSEKVRWEIGWVRPSKTTMAS